MKFQEGSYEQHLDQYNVCPYLSAYVLGYSKMLTQTEFQFLDSIGAELLYTDTDSIVFIATDHQWEQYRRKFVPEVKTFGGMALEEEGVRTLNIGAKKYVVEHDGGSYSWHANGIRARQNVHLDIRAMFEAVLRGQIENVCHFSIYSCVNYQLRHTEPGVSKKVRFICLKGQSRVNITMRRRTSA